MGSSIFKKHEILNESSLLIFKRLNKVTVFQINNFAIASLKPSCFLCFSCKSVTKIVKGYLHYKTILCYKVELDVINDFFI